MPPRSQAMTAHTTQCFCLYLRLSPTLPTSVVLNQIPPKSQLQHILQLDDPPALMNAPHTSNSATQPCLPNALWRADSTNPTQTAQEYP